MRWRYVYVSLILVGLLAIGIAYQLGKAPRPIPGYEASHENPALHTDPLTPPAFTFPGSKTDLQHEYRFVALYGTPGVPSMGALGAQPLTETIERVTSLAHEHQTLSNMPIYPTLEIITTVASSTPTANGDYSNELSIEMLEPWITAAQAAGTYVILDLQPGRTDFLTQAKQYESLLRRPHVGLALDPEWRLTSEQTPMRFIGSVTAEEINDVAAWLDTLITTHQLPPKVLLLHQFKTSMIQNRERLHISAKLWPILQMDGHGTQSVKQDTWRVLQQNLPQRLDMGWKNFYQRDTPMLTPAQTLNITPTPWFISYQ